jgi:hypothetical protein
MTILDLGQLPVDLRPFLVGLQVGKLTIQKGRIRFILKVMRPFVRDRCHGAEVYMVGGRR